MSASDIAISFTHCELHFMYIIMALPFVWHCNTVYINAARFLYNLTNIIFGRHRKKTSRFFFYFIVYVVAQTNNPIIYFIVCNESYATVQRQALNQFVTVNQRMNTSFISHVQKKKFSPFCHFTM